MQLLISAEGEHDPPGRHLVRLDNHQILLDLARVNGTLHDPTIARVTWGFVSRGNETREGGTIVLTDGTERTFFDRGLLKPYLDAFHAAVAAAGA